MFKPGLIFAALALMVWGLLISFLPSSILIELLTALMLPLGGMALWRWGPGALRNLFSDAPTPAKILTIAVAAMAFAASFQSIWRLVYLWLHRPDSMTGVVNPWASAATYIFIVSLVLYLLSTRRETDPPMPALMWVVAIGALAVLAVGFTIRLAGTAAIFGSF